MSALVKQGGIEVVTQSSFSSCHPSSLLRWVSVMDEHLEALHELGALPDG
ncbi:hypothetical protein [Prochlorococcus marinus]|nr:hypothetical protein [Prochlorococcus marinus]